jgi:translation initiation factor IF-2
MSGPIRLNKALKELNISLDRAVEFLSSNKIKIDARPTTKIDKKIYDLFCLIFHNHTKKLFISL